METRFQGDLSVTDGNRFPSSTTTPFKADYIKGNKSVTVLHEGEGRDHFHVVVGEDVTVEEFDKINLKGIRAWKITAPKGAKLQHIDGKTGTATLEHGSVDLAPGITTVGTQREADPIEEFVPHTD